MAFSVAADIKKTVVLDAGHGGEDGGAVSADGVKESCLNLEITEKLRDILRFRGQTVILTREEDRSLNHGEDTIRGRKASDLKARTAVVNQTRNPVLISIHQNSLPASPVTHGAQVFWNGQDGSCELAQQIQADLNTAINPERYKRTRKIPSSVYLMKHSAAPAVLIECGFLSNQQETKLLQTPYHQQKLALCIAAGLLRWGAREEIP